MTGARSRRLRPLVVAAAAGSVVAVAVQLAAVVSRELLAVLVLFAAGVRDALSFASLRVHGRERAWQCQVRSNYILVQATCQPQTYPTYPIFL